MAWYDQYAHSSPYPPLRVVKSNPEYAEILMDDYAGAVSEFTAINLYLYHHYWFDELDEELSEAIEGIAIIEMRHLEMLAGLIKLLGGDPKFRGFFNNMGKSWTTHYVKYGVGIIDWLMIDIRAEQEAIDNYQKHIRMIADPFVQEILKRIILDEREHIKIFNAFVKKYAQKSDRPAH